MSAAVEFYDDTPARRGGPETIFGAMPGKWADQALCAQTDPDAFFPEKGASARVAKQVCAACPVAAECLDHALATRERFGIWGGVTERNRRTLATPPPLPPAA